MSLWSYNNVGFQVVISSYNASSYLEECFESLNYSLNGYNWILHFGDDGSTDSTLTALGRGRSASGRGRFAGSALGRGRFTGNDLFVYSFEKAQNVAIAKNRVLKNIHKYSHKYPAILFMDADDRMLPERPKMIKTAIENNSKYVTGTLMVKGRYEFGDQKYQKLKISPCSTIIHHSVVSGLMEQYGMFFYQGVEIYEDYLTFAYLKHIKNIHGTVHSKMFSPVHYYHRNPTGLTSVLRTKEGRKKHTKKYTKTLAAILQNRDIYIDGFKP